MCYHGLGARVKHGYFGVFLATSCLSSAKVEINQDPWLATPLSYRTEPPDRAMLPARGARKPSLVPVSPMVDERARRREPAGHGHLGLGSKERLGKADGYAEIRAAETFQNGNRDADDFALRIEQRAAGAA